MPHNAANRDSFPFSAPGTAYSTTPSLRWYLTGNGKLEVRVYVDGKKEFNPPSESNGVQLKFQGSDDGIVWADINPDGAGAPDIACVPMGEAFAHISVSQRHLRVLAFGNDSGMLDMSWSGLDGLQLVEF